MLKGACVNDFNSGTYECYYEIEEKFFCFFFFEGRTLSVLNSTQLQIDPDLTIAHELRKWYLDEGMNVDMKDLTIQPNKHENSKIILKKRKTLFLFFLKLVPLKTFGHVNEYELNMPLNGVGELFRVKAVCTVVRHDPVYKVANYSLY